MTTARECHVFLTGKWENKVRLIQDLDPSLNKEKVSVADAIGLFVRKLSMGDKTVIISCYRHQAPPTTFTLSGSRKIVVMPVDSSTTKDAVLAQVDEKLAGTSLEAAEAPKPL